MRFAASATACSSAQIAGGPPGPRNGFDGGEWDTTTDIVHWHELVGFDRSLLERELRQRMELYDRARGQEPGKQGKAA